MVMATLQALQVSQLDEIVVVTGHESSEIQQLVEGLGVRTVFNKNFALGMTKSIQKGVALLENEGGIMICLGDMPFLSYVDIDVLINHFNSNPDSITVPSRNGLRGNPVIFPAYMRDKILSHKEPEGCRKLILENMDRVAECEVLSDNYFADIDTWNDYTRI